MSEQYYLDVVAMCVHIQVGGSRLPSTISGPWEHEVWYHVAMHIFYPQIMIDLENDDCMIASNNT